MLSHADLYYFSPTGGTRAAADLLAGALAEQICSIDLCRPGSFQPGSHDTAIFAMPVFAGRIPTVAAEKIRSLDGRGKTAVTLAVYGVRAYDDALLELNDVVEAAGFTVTGSAAVIARHSMVPAVGAGRPDRQDAEQLRAFAAAVLEKPRGRGLAAQVPGNRPYREGMNQPLTPISLPACGGCGVCAQICPLQAVTVTADGVSTAAADCILCMACTAACPAGARILPPPLVKTMTEKLGPLAAVRRENEFYL